MSDNIKTKQAAVVLTSLADKAEDRRAEVQKYSTDVDDLASSDAR